MNNDRTYSVELRSSQDSYRIYDKKQRQNTLSTELLQKYSKSQPKIDPLDAVKSIRINNFINTSINDENDAKVSNTKLSSSRISKNEYEVKIQTLKNENRKLVYMLESSEQI